MDSNINNNVYHYLIHTKLELKIKIMYIIQPHTLKPQLHQTGVIKTKLVSSILFKIYILRKHKTANL